MNYFKIFTIAIVIFWFNSLQTYGQHHPEQNDDANHHTFKPFRVGLMMYHTYIGTETSAGKNLLIVPAMGLDIEYWFNPTWGIGSHNDLELINFEVQEGESHLLERETPLLLTIDALWKPYKGLVLMLGPGIEIERRENLFVIRGGLEYEIELKSHWDIAPTIFYDVRKDAYDTFSVGIGVGKRF